MHARRDEGGTGVARSARIPCAGGPEHVDTRSNTDERQHMNIVALVGNLASEPELRQTAGGRAVCTFRIAVNRAGGEQADFFTVVAWERQAEICKEYLALGRRVAVEGRMHHSTWETDDGRRSKVEVIAHRVDLIGSRPRAADTASAEDASGAIDAATSIDSDDPFATTSDDRQLVVT
ncbi:MAG: hypothetical protein JWN72_2758 [Thermoleophilia bacterium]|nr:hypothetical protein [Thermoleophilia bacterium]